MEPERPPMLAAAFEFVAIASIWEICHGSFLDAPALSVLRGLAAQDERKRRWDAVKIYFQHSGVHRYRDDSNDEFWFWALNTLVKVTLGQMHNDRPKAYQATINGDELSELVHACMADGVLKATNVPWHCYYIKRFLESGSTSRREDFCESSMQTITTWAGPQESAHWSQKSHQNN